jgi:hypothetical protein
LMGILRSFIAWIRSRPVKTLVIMVALESLVFVSLLVILIWVILAR